MQLLWLATFSACLSALALAAGDGASCLSARSLALLPEVATDTVTRQSSATPRRWFTFYNSLAEQQVVTIKLNCSYEKAALENDAALEVFQSCDAQQQPLAHAHGRCAELTIGAWPHASLVVVVSEGRVDGAAFEIFVRRVDAQPSSCSAAHAVSALPYTDSGTTGSLASTQESSCVPKTARQGAWYTVRSAAAGAALSAHSCLPGTDFASSVEVYTACGGSTDACLVGPGQLAGEAATTLLACRNGWIARWVAPTAGTEYRVFVSGSPLNVGSYAVALQQGEAEADEAELSCVGALEAAMPGKTAAASTARDKQYAPRSAGTCPGHADLPGTWFALPALEVQNSTKAGANANVNESEGAQVSAAVSCKKTGGAASSGAAPRLLVYAACDASSSEASRCVMTEDPENGTAVAAGTRQVTWFAERGARFWVFASGCEKGDTVELTTSLSGPCNGTTVVSHSSAGSVIPAPGSSSSSSSSSAEIPYPWYWPKIDWTPLKAIGAVAIVVCVLVLLLSGVAFCVARRRRRYVAATHVELMPLEVPELGAETDFTATSRRPPPQLASGSPRFVVEGSEKTDA